MAPAVSLLANLLGADRGPIDGSRLKRLQSAATLDGRVDPAERAVLRGLGKDGRIEAGLRGPLDAWLKAPTSPEVAYVRKGAPAFDARVAAVAKHARPGDLLFWQDPRGTAISKLLGEFSHVSLVLGEGKVLDTMALEGVSIATTEAAVAKASRRMKAGAIAIGRPAERLSATQIAALGKAAAGIQGRDYALLSSLRDAASALSCSRSVYEALKAIGIDLAPEGRRVVRNAVMPGDLMKAVKAVGTVGEDGVFRAAGREGFAAWNPSRLVRLLGGAWDHAMTWFPGLWSFAMKVQAKMVRKLRI
jgi:hypothetical protein